MPLEEGKSAQWLHPLQDLQKPSQDEKYKTLDTMEDTMALEKNLNQACGDLHAMGLVHPTPTPSLWLPGEPLPGWTRETNMLEEVGPPPD